MLGGDRDYQRINPGDDVAFPTYPELYDLNGARPILRKGTVASDPINNYEAAGQQSGRRIAYEAHSTKGSSGSPVFAIVNAAEAGTPSKPEVVLIGINTGHLVGEDPRIGAIHAGLSYAYKAPCIYESIVQIQRERTAA
jgi:hypothetical protein